MATRTGRSHRKTATSRAHLVEIAFGIDLLDLHLKNPDRYPYLLESTADDTALGRYDILFAFPQESLRLDSQLRLHGAADPGERGFLYAFDEWWAELREPVPAATESPFRGGWYVFLGYELAGEIEPRLRMLPHPGMPVAVATRIPVAVVRDRANSKAWIVTEPGYESAADEIRHDLATMDPGVPAGRSPISADGMAEDAPRRFLDAVACAQRYIAAGEIYQANISRQWSGRLSSDTGPAELYRRLRRTNPAPFAGLAVFDDACIISSSPERLLRVDGRRVETRPIAGTRPRDPDDRDIPHREALLRHPKERAEHVMLIDLERNDLGRICEPGSVRVDQFMTVESYSHVHHIVSNVSGRLQENATPATAIRAVFPGGSITGCPKVRCMEIIRELEDRARGAYTGAMGYFNRDGSGDLNILIRTMTTIGRELSFATGSGIVADSEPGRELAETRAKAKGLLLALDGDG